MAYSLIEGGRLWNNPAYDADTAGRTRPGRQNQGRQSARLSAPCCIPGPAGATEHNKVLDPGSQLSSALFRLSSALPPSIPAGPSEARSRREIPTLHRAGKLIARLCHGLGQTTSPATDFIRLCTAATADRCDQQVQRPWRQAMTRSGFTCGPACSAPAGRAIVFSMPFRP